MGCSRAAFHHISVHQHRTEISARVCCRRGQKAYPLPPANAPREWISKMLISAWSFRPASSGLVLTDMIDTPLPSSKYSPNPFSSPTRTNTRRSPTPCTVDSVESQGYTSSQADQSQSEADGTGPRRLATFRSLPTSRRARQRRSERGR